MPFELTLATSSIASNGKSFNVIDESVWADADDLRTSFGVFLVVEKRVSNTPESVSVIYDPLVDNAWNIQATTNGRYTVKAYAFYEIGEGPAPVADDVKVDAQGNLQEYDGAQWNPVELENVLGSAYYESDPLEMPFLSYAYVYKNKLNLEYIRQVKADIDNGAQQNKLYYKRSDLDYFNALIKGAEYNWSLELYSNYYQIVENLNAIIESEEIQ